MNKPYCATRPEDLPQLQDVMSRTGLQILEDMLSGEIASSAICDTMGFQMLSIEPGKSVFEGVPEFNVTNPMGTVHGGWYSTVLDSCMGCAIMSVRPKATTYTTLELKVNVVRSIPLGAKVHAVGTLQHSGRTTAVANGEIRGVEDGRLYATGSTTCLFMAVSVPE